MSFGTKISKLRKGWKSFKIVIALSLSELLILSLSLFDDETISNEVFFSTAWWNENTKFSSKNWVWMRDQIMEIAR